VTKKRAIHSSGEKTCEGCGGLCCSYAAVETDAPTSIDDYEDLVFYIYHGVKVSVAQDDPRKRTWFLEFPGRCRYLTAEGLCTIYEHRPRVCREHDIEECERYNHEEITDITTVAELFALMKRIGRGPWLKSLKARLPKELR